MKELIFGDHVADRHRTRKFYKSPRRSDPPGPSNVDVMADSQDRPPLARPPPVVSPAVGARRRLESGTACFISVSLSARAHVIRY